MNARLKLLQQTELLLYIKLLGELNLNCKHK